ncbi:carboxypeptidase regulatory-like domain-containing protein [Planctomicrobium piriforme]|uniref:Rhamnogalacturonan lyase domain-containing protein n=1 Tax=Planctomicrobium piriforme TaxID=1576369 RepID=A0A1I3ICZ8_9PLAN|nr:carboxypeptidase regulatory-like domain-containing protein [Planctomicrobium piriforme]SFI45760.1 hypothetical protein SAMN05421753_10966 [Planctomicrobium piriforme]
MVRFAWSVALALALTGQSWAGDYGSVEGQYVLEGAVPTPEPLVAKGNPNVKDTATCAAINVPNDARAFDPESKGIANIFVYLRRAPSDIHPDLKASATKEVEFDQKYCRFLPHALIVRTDQVVVCKSDDDVAHNLHSNPFANTPANFIVQPNDRTGTPVKMPSPEALPVKIQCDIHPWMSAWWVVLDHPYAAVTDKDGKFKIENLPVGEHEFRVWHEDAGYVDRKLTVKVKAGETTTLEPKKVPLSAFEKK